jgi:hypothetical protein
MCADSAQKSSRPSSQSEQQCDYFDLLLLSLKHRNNIMAQHPAYVFIVVVVLTSSAVPVAPTSRHHHLGKEATQKCNNISVATLLQAVYELFTGPSVVCFFMVSI